MHEAFQADVAWEFSFSHIASHAFSRPTSPTRPATTKTSPGRTPSTPCRQKLRAPASPWRQCRVRHSSKLAMPRCQHISWPLLGARPENRVESRNWLRNAPPGGLIKYQIATYLCCNPQDAFHKVEDSSWEGQLPLQSPNSVLVP